MKFQIDPQVLGPNSCDSITVGATTDADVLDALAKDSPFPKRVNGQIPLESITLQASDKNPISFTAGPAGTVSFQFSASFKTGVGVFDKPADALSSLGLDSAPKLDLTIPGGAACRYVLMLCGYQASGSFSGSHPIGALGTVTFGANVSGDQLYAILRRIPGTTGAATALRETIGAWRLPRHVSHPDDLKPGTWIIAQADGSVSIQLAAQLGYDFNFVRQATLLGVTRSLSAKIDAGVNACFGFDASGKYLIVIGRETDASIVRLRLFKQSTQGFNCGLNLNVGVTQESGLPATTGDLVQAVFGVHVLQVIQDLRAIEQWTDYTKDLLDKAARLPHKTGLDLLTKATGVDASQEFDKARQAVVQALQEWDALPDGVSAALWKILGNPDAVATADFKTFLTALTAPDAKTRSQAFAEAVAQVSFGDSARGQFLEAIADRGLLALSNDPDQVQQVASRALNVLNKGVLRNIGAFIEEHLNLNQVANIDTQEDFNKVDGWLLKRLSDFLDQEMDLAGLKETRAAMALVIQKASDIGKKALHALNNQYSLSLAQTYQRTATDTALLDVNFDLDNPAARALLQDVVANSHLDHMLVDEVAGVTLNQAALSHEIKRNAEVQLQMPFLNLTVQHVNDSLASLTVEHDSGRVLAYQTGATDTVTVSNRYQSQLSVLGKLEVVNGKLHAGALGGSSVAYQSLQVKAGMARAELESRTAPFIESMLPNVFADSECRGRFYAGLGHGIADDVAINLQIALPASVLSAWFQPLSGSDVKIASMRMSRALQAQLRSLLARCYFEDLKNLQANPTAAALLVWSAMPVSTSIDFQDGRIARLNTDQDVFWNAPDPGLRRAMALDSHTTRTLIPALAAAHGRWMDAGDSHMAAFFTEDQAGFFQKSATDSAGDTLLQSLLFTEAEMARGALAALNDVQAALSDLATAPTNAIPLLARFGADLTETFHKRLSVYSSVETLRTLNSLVLVEASKALDPSALAATPTAMLSLLVLKNGHAFQLSDYLSGKLPAKKDVAVAQTLTSSGS